MNPNMLTAISTVQKFIQSNPNVYQQFANSVQGDPKQLVQQMLNTGKMSQQQYNYLMQIAQALQSNSGV